MDIAATSMITSPQDDAGGVTGRPQIQGLASHPTGVRVVSVILRGGGEGAAQRFWNQAAGVWQNRYVANPVEAFPAEGDPTRARWQFTPDTTLPSGTYRVRSQARANNGQGDPNSTFVDFEVENTDETGAGGRAGLALFQNPVQDPDVQAATDAPTAPKVRVADPVNGGAVTGNFRLRVTAESRQEGAPVERLELTVARLDPDTAFWDFETESWQPAPPDPLVFRQSPSATALTDTYDFELGQAPPGEYSATAVAFSADGADNPRGRTNTFSVLAPLSN